MPQLVWFAIAAALIASPVMAQTAVPDLRGTWKGASEAVVLGTNPHNPRHHSGEPQFVSRSFTVTISRQEGRRFYGTFSSEHASEPFVGIISRGGTIYVVDDDGHNFGSLLAPDRIEMCYLHIPSAAAPSHIASCTEFVKQP